VVANGIEFTWSDLAQGAKNLAGVAEVVSTKAGVPIADTIVAVPPAAWPLNRVPKLSVSFQPAEKYLGYVKTLHTQMITGAHEFGTATDLLSTAITDMTKRYDGVVQADSANAAQLQQGLSEAEGASNG
jgi:hypothetical protein